MSPEHQEARKKGEAAYHEGLDQVEDNPYRDGPDERYGKEWHWSDAWWQAHMDHQDRKRERQS